VIEKDDGTSKPFLIVAPNGSKAWYVAEAVRLADGSSTVASTTTASTRRPTAGDRVVLTPDYASHDAGECVSVGLCDCLESCAARAGAGPWVG
jgi:hypothetical protein